MKFFQSSFLQSRIGQGLSVLLLSTALYLLIQPLVQYFFGLNVYSWPKDIVAHGLFAILTFLLCKSVKTWMIAFSLTLIIFHVSNGLKFTILGSPIMPDDFGSAVNMIFLFDDWRQWLVLIALILPVALWAMAIAWKSIAMWVLLIFYTASSLAFVQYARPIVNWMDGKWGDRIWDQPGNYRDRGLVLHLVHETSRTIARGQVVLTDEQIIQAREQLMPQGIDQIVQTGLVQRNVNLVLLESFWDPMLLTKAGIERDPFDPRFRALWESTNNSTILAPVFGGYTANSEFEVLCGFPVDKDRVFFEGWLRNDAPCLPEVLKQAGMETIASHPNYAAFWNRVNAYRRVGFEHYWSIKDFTQEDMNHSFMSDSSFLEQVWNKNQEQKGDKARFNYMVTIFGHLDYPLNEARPHVIGVENDPGMVKKYVNTVYYKTTELMDYYEAKKQEDPDALWIFFGDHLPFLGPKYSGFVESGLLTADKSSFNAKMFKTFSKTPLVIINGEAGVVEKHDLPLFRLPALILDLLGIDTERNMLNATALPEGVVIRPLPGITLSQKHGDEAVLCVEGKNSLGCESTYKWQSPVKILTNDIFTGQQRSFLKSFPTDHR